MKRNWKMHDENSTMSSVAIWNEADEWKSSVMHAMSILRTTTNRIQ